MRIVKAAEERRNEILDVAEKLFAEKGFDQASTNDILKEVRIARGTLYYHFKSKEDILDALIGRMCERYIGKTRGIAESRSIPVPQRLAMMILALNTDHMPGRELVEPFDRPQNALMYQKLRERLLREINPLMAELIREGISIGICRTNYPEEAAEMAMLYSSISFSSLAGLEPEERRRKIAAFIYNLERLLGMEEGSLTDTMLPLI